MSDFVLPETIARLAPNRCDESFLSHHHIEAAQRVARLFQRSHLQQRVTMSYDPTRVGGGGSRPMQSDIATSVAEARAQLNKLANMLPKDCYLVLSDICFSERGFQEIEVQRQWPRRSAKLVLRIALEQLALHWGLCASAQGAASEMKTWLPERPAMFAGVAD